MNRRTFVKALPAITVLASTTAGFSQDTPSPTQDLKPITLPKPEMDGGKSVLAALKERKTTRNISSKELPPPGPVKPALGSLRSEPGERLIRQTRQDRRVGEQLAGDRFVCGSARRRVSV